jgi:cell division control protein 6
METIIINKFEILFIMITTENRIKSFKDVVVRDTIFKNKEVLKKGYIPKYLNDLLHRDDIIQTYINYLSDAMNNYVPNNIFIFGKTGVGKTVLTELILKDLEHTATERGINILSIYLNCETVSTDTAILKVLINQVWKKFGNSTEKIINSFDQAVPKPPTVDKYL